MSNTVWKSRSTHRRLLQSQRDRLAELLNQINVLSADPDNSGHNIHRARALLREADHALTMIQHHEHRFQWDDQKCALIEESLHNESDHAQSASSGSRKSQLTTVPEL